MEACDDRDAILPARHPLPAAAGEDHDLMLPRDRPLLALNDSLRKSFELAVKDLADLWNELQCRLEFGEYDAIQERPDHNEENDDDRQAP